MKTCEEYQELISAYIDNELSDGETSQMFFHLGECSECREMMNLMLRLRTTLLEVDGVLPQEHPQSTFWKKKLAISYPIAAVIVMAICISTVMFFQKITQPPTIVEKMQTEYVYMTSFPPVYAKINSPEKFKSN